MNGRMCKCMAGNSNEAYDVSHACPCHCAAQWKAMQMAQRIEDCLPGFNVFCVRCNREIGEGHQYPPCACFCACQAELQMPNEEVCQSSSQKKRCRRRRNRQRNIQCSNNCCQCQDSCAQTDITCCQTPETDNDNEEPGFVTVTNIFEEEAALTHRTGETEYVLTVRQSVAMIPDDGSMPVVETTDISKRMSVTQFGDVSEETIETRQSVADFSDAAGADTKVAYHFKSDRSLESKNPQSDLGQASKDPQSDLGQASKDPRSDRSLESKNRQSNQKQISKDPPSDRKLESKDPQINRIQMPKNFPSDLKLESNDPRSDRPFSLKGGSVGSATFQNSHREDLASNTKSGKFEAARTVTRPGRSISASEPISNRHRFESEPNVIVYKETVESVKHVPMESDAARNTDLTKQIAEMSSLNPTENKTNIGLVGSPVDFKSHIGSAGNVPTASAGKSLASDEQMSGLGRSSNGSNVSVLRIKTFLRSETEEKGSGSDSKYKVVEVVDVVTDEVRIRPPEPEPEPKKKKCWPSSEKYPTDDMVNHWVRKGYDCGRCCDCNCCYGCCPCGYCCEPACYSNCGYCMSPYFP